MLERLRAGARPRRAAARRRCARRSTFFDDARGATRSDLRTVVGELYFECHRGTYTSQAAIKRGNRRGEGALHDAELLRRAARATAYPRERARRGSGGRCCSTSSTTSCPGTLDHRGQRARPRGPRRRRGRRRGDRRAAACSATPASVPVNPRGVRAPRGRRGADGELVLVDLPPCGAGRVVDGDDAVDGRARRRRGRARPTRTCARARRATARCTSLVHRAAARRWRRPATGSSSTRTTPSRWDAWDVDPAHLETRARLPARARPRRVERAPAAGRGRLRARSASARARARRPARRRLAPARVPHGGRLAGGPPLLKVAFPLAVRATEATYEVAFGAVQRPDALLDARRPRPLRGPRPPLGRPVRARLRRRRCSPTPSTATARSATRCGSRCCARRGCPDPRGRPRPAHASPTPSSPTPAAGRTRAWSRRRRRSTRRCAGARCAARLAGERDAAGSCSTPSSAPRTPTRSSCASTSRTAAAAPRACACPAHRARGARTCSRSRGEALTIEDGEIVVPFRPWEIVTDLRLLVLLLGVDLHDLAPLARALLVSANSSSAAERIVPSDST